MKNDKKISATDLESQVFEKEQIRVVIRAHSDERFEPYTFERKAANNTSVSDWMENRLRKCIGDADAEIIKGDGTRPHGRTNMETLRNSYKVN